MSARRRPWSPIVGRVRDVSRTTLGLLVIVMVLATIFAVYQKERIVIAFSAGDTIEAEFAQDYKLRPYRNDVKINGVVVGSVTGIERGSRDTTIVSMELQDGVGERLGSRPSASIRPTLLLGGNYYVDLKPGGRGPFEDGRIPHDRTTVPVELDRVLARLTPPAQEGMQAAIGQMDLTLSQGGEEAVQDVLRDAPGTLRPAGSVLDATRGTRPGTDLTEIVSGLQSTASALNRHDGQLESIIGSLHTTTASLAAESRPLSDAVSTMPETMRTTRAGLADLQGTLRRLTSTAEEFRPAAQELDRLLTDLDPVLARTRPLMRELRPLLHNTRPLVEQLVPTAQQSTAALNDVRGPVLDRVNGPITQAVVSEWTGTGPYAGGGGNGHRFYEELAYLGYHAAQVYGWYDRNGGITRVSAGVGLNTAFPMSLEQYLETLGMRQPPGPQPEGSPAARSPVLAPPQPPGGGLPSGLMPLLPAPEQSGAPR